MRKRIIFGIGIGILILLLALAGTGSAKSNGQFGFSCNNCHAAITPEAAVFYNQTHRYNETVINPPNCDNCHVSVSATPFNMNLSLKTGTPTYLTSTTCENCHKQKYDTWYNGTHRIKLTDKNVSQAAGFPVPPGYTWDNIIYTIGGKWKIRFVNETGYVITGTQAQYDVEMKKWNAYDAGKVTPYNCGGCHTTGYNKSAPSRFGLPGIVGNWTENGIGCEACHSGAGNGHQVVVNKSAELCGNCHTRDGTTNIDKQRRHRAQFADWANSEHASPSKAPVTTESCRRCHSPLDYAENKSITSETARGIVCAVCHNPHDISDPKYADLTKPGAYNFNVSDNSSNFADVKPAKVGFFNSSASRTAGRDVYDILTTPTLIYDRDSNYPGPINVTGPISEVLCSKCHYNHGLSHIGQVNLTHARKNYPSDKWATCTDCHMPKSRKSAVTWDIRSHTMKLNDEIKYTTAPTNNFPDLTCSRGTECHVTSDQNLSKSKYSVVPVVNEWKASAHNDREVGIARNPNSSFYRSINATTGVVTIRSRPNSCLKCHSPLNWDPMQDENTTSVPLPENFKGITCAVCHNLHDMGDWLAKTNATFGKAKPYAWYDRDAIPRKNATTGAITGYRANYSMIENTVELCGNCHDNIRRGREGPGWASATATTPIAPHGFPAKDIFVGSWKQSGILKFECIDCHMYSKTTNDAGGVLTDSEKIKGHSFAVNATGLQSTSNCNTCHVSGTKLDTIPNVIEELQAATHTKWNSTNGTVMAALAQVNAYTGEKNLSRNKIAQAYWNLREVSSDESWGVHNPTKVNELLDDASRLANEAILALGQKEIVSRVQLKAGWNLAALNGTPAVTSAASVMDSVKNNITVVWGYNTTKANLGQMPWELYDPAMPAVLNTLKNIVPGKGYWIYAKTDVEWTS